MSLAYLWHRYVTEVPHENRASRGVDEVDGRVPRHAGTLMSTSALAPSGELEGATGGLDRISGGIARGTARTDRPSDGARRASFMLGLVARPEGFEPPTY